MRSRAVFLATLVSLAFGGAAVAQETPKADGAKAHKAPKAVVELFTSQGCASCPPADALLGELGGDPDVLVLTLAVDYWDYIGWKDTLALHGHGVRQKGYAEQRPDRKVYTPQAIVDGVAAAKGSDRAAVENAMARVPGEARVLNIAFKTSRSEGDLVVDLPASEHAAGGAEVWLCPVARRQTVTIGRGENGGRTVTYTNVVRGWVRLGSWNGAAETFKVPLAQARREGADAAVVLVQSGTAGRPGPILGAAVLPFD